MKTYNLKELKEIKGDASFRKFFRKKKNNFSSIIIFAEKEKEKNLLQYDAINNILIKNRILAPRLFNEKYSEGFIEVEDFGNNTIYKILKNKNINRLKYFKKIIKLLNQIQLIKDVNIKNFKNKNYKVPTYNKKILFDEANLFCNWYIKSKLLKKNEIKFRKQFKKIIKKLISNLKLKNNTFVHRDFHVSNLMLKKNKIGVIDSQDALIGNKAYDLASLIDDVRLKTSDLFKVKVFKYYIKTQIRIDIKKFQNDFQILSVLRNLKIIGIFTRLSIRDKKNNYLKLIPYTWVLLNKRIKENKIFDDLKILLNKHLAEQIK